MIYAFARDGGIPGHRFFHSVDKRWKSPVRTGESLDLSSDSTQFRIYGIVWSVWLSCLLAFLLGLPSLGSSVAFSAATSIATIGLYISYGTPSFCAAARSSLISLFTAIPIALRVIYAERFVRGPFHLGRLSLLVASVAVIWTCFISIVFILPQLNPVNSQTLNYAIVAVGIVLTYSIGFWFISARRWFSGPVKQIEQETLGMDVMDPATVIQVEDKRGSVEKD